MSKQQYPYPDDEFDVVGAARTPKGVHREPIPRWKQWVPYLLVLILVPLLTIVAVKFFASPESNGTPEVLPTESISPTDEPADVDADAGEEADADGATVDPGDEETEGADGEDAETGSDDSGANAPGDEVDYSVHVLILNGAGINGLAGQVSDLLAADGWTNTEPETHTGTTPTVTTLYYTSEAFAAEAREIGERLGIDNLVEDSSSASNGVVIVLRFGFTAPAA